jgi:PAS domain-containing protein
VAGEFAAAERGRPLAVHHPEVPALKKDGSRLEVSVSVSGLYEQSGRLPGASAFLRDISEQKRAERQISRMGSIIEASQDPVVVVDTECRIIGSGDRKGARNRIRQGCLAGTA